MEWGARLGEMPSSHCPLLEKGSCMWLPWEHLLCSPASIATLAASAARETANITPPSPANLTCSGEVGPAPTPWRGANQGSPFPLVSPDWAKGERLDLSRTNGRLPWDFGWGHWKQHWLSAGAG